MPLLLDRQRNDHRLRLKVLHACTFVRARARVHARACVHACLRDEVRGHSAAVAFKHRAERVANLSFART